MSASAALAGAAPRERSLVVPFGVSALLHGMFALSLVLTPRSAAPARPPMYRVNLVAAPPGPAAEGVVAPAPAPASPVPTPAVARKAPPPKAMIAPRPTPAKKVARPPAMAAAPAMAPKAAPAPAAAGGPEGGRGADVASIRTEGIEFPFPGYLENIVRAIAVRFRPPPNTAVRAEVMFLIRRDGSVVPNSLQFITRSGNFAFDLEAQGVIEQAGAVKAFGPLPAGFADDVLPVVFSFDPRVLH